MSNREYTWKDHNMYPGKPGGRLRRKHFVPAEGEVTETGLYLGRRHEAFAVHSVEFEVFDEDLSTFFPVLVPWQRVFVYLRAHPAASVKKVWWADYNGNIGHSGWTFAKWWLDTLNDTYSIGVGAYGDDVWLEEIKA